MSFSPCAWYPPPSVWLFHCSRMLFSCPSTEHESFKGLMLLFHATVIGSLARFPASALSLIQKPIIDISEVNLYLTILLNSRQQFHCIVLIGLKGDPPKNSFCGSHYFHFTLSYPYNCKFFLQSACAGESRHQFLVTSHRKTKHFSMCLLVNILYQIRKGIMILSVSNLCVVGVLKFVKDVFFIYPSKIMLFPIYYMLNCF